eukprot:Hpha_TRINITY_DN16537_c0_g4::TRINITY_DN16537_c0_g4_i2::g.136531::m.136531
MATASTTTSNRGSMSPSRLSQRYGEEMQMGVHKLFTEGLSAPQLATLSAVGADLSEKNQTIERLVARDKRLQEGIEERDALLRSRDEEIRKLREKEAADVQAFKEQQRKSYSSLEISAAALSAQLQDRETELQTVKLDLAQAQQRLTLLQLKVDELEEERRRGGSDSAMLQSAHGEALQSARDRAKGTQRRAEEAEAKATALAEQLKEKDSALKGALKDLEQARRNEDRAVQDLRFYKSTATAEMERQGQELVVASEQIKSASADAQAAKAEVLRFEAKLRASELTVQDQVLEITRLHSDVQRLNEELEHLRKTQGDLHVEMVRLEVVNQQRADAVADLRQQLQEGAQESDLSLRQTYEAAERLRRVEDGISALLAPDRETPRGKVPTTPRIDHAESASLLAEVERAEKNWENLHAHLQEMHWGKKAQEEGHRRDRALLEDKHATAERGLKEVGAEAEKLRGLLQLQKEEHDARAALDAEEKRKWVEILRSVSAAKLAVLEERKAGEKRKWVEILRSVSAAKLAVLEERKAG